MNTVNADLKSTGAGSASGVAENLVKGRAAVSWLHFFSVATMGIWLGAMIFFSFILAPAAFKVIVSRHLTGTLVTILLTKLNIGTLILVPVWFIACLVRNNFQQTGKIRVVQMLLLGLTALSTIASEFFLTPKMVALRTQMVSIDNTPIDNPLRIAFNYLHHYSVLAIIINMLSILILLFIATRERRA